MNAQTTPGLSQPTDKTLAVHYKKTSRVVRDWRLANLIEGRDYETPEPGKPVIWTDYGLRKLESEWGDLKALKVYGTCPNLKFVRVYEINDRDHTGFMELPRRWRGRLDRGHPRTFYGYRTENAKRYQFVY